jgi:hypothetical protein
MTEADWLACTDPERMLDFLQERGNDRRLRLFAVACCRSVWGLLTDERSRAAVEVSERYADGRATLIELVAARRRAVQATKRRGQGAAWSAYWAASRRITGSLQNVCEAVGDATAPVAAGTAKAAGANQLAAWNADWSARRRDYVYFLRDIFGNPFRAVPVEPAWLAWSGGIVGKMARSIYDERRFGDLPVLADALEEAGCTDREILEHCRSAGGTRGQEHVRGCWVLDRLLGNPAEFRGGPENTGEGER